MPRTPAPSVKKQQLTLAQLAAYDDILTDALVDHTYYWTTIPKNRPSYHPSRGVKEAEITKILQAHVIIDPDLALAEERLLATEGLKKFYSGLKTPREKDDFRRHLRRYLQIYLPDCPFEVSSTNRYTIVTHEASITARRFIKRNETIKHLCGIQVTITPEEEREISRRKKDFSIVVSSRNKCTSLFMGPARFANHDCDANARLQTTGQAGMEVIAIRDIQVGDEITVTYGESYFGEDNCECLCKTCEDNLANGWATTEGMPPVKKSIEEDLVAAAQGYSLRRRRRDESACDVSRTSSVTPDIRPRVSKRKSLKMLGDRASTVDSAAPERAGSALKRKLEADCLATPPVTPAKKQKTIRYEISPAPPSASSRGSSDDEAARGASLSDSNNGEAVLTDVTSPEGESPEPLIHSPKPTPIKRVIQVLKQEEEVNDLVQHVPESVSSKEAKAVSPLGPAAASPLPPASSVGSPFSPPAAVTVIAVPAAHTAVLTPTPSQSADTAVPPAADMMAPSPKDSIPVPSISLPTPCLQPSDNTGPVEAAINAVAAAPPTPTPPTRGRGRSLHRSTLSASSITSTGSNRPTPPPRTRVPGDYTLTPLLLSEPETAWIHCTVCNNAFVQRNAYYTKSACPRCERHSILYGFMWPKTEPAGRWDDEERVLDHRTVHRFLGAEEEAKARGRQVPAYLVGRARKELEEESPEKVNVDWRKNGKMAGEAAGGRKRKAESKAVKVVKSVKGTMKRGLTRSARATPARALKRTSGRDRRQVRPGLRRSVRGRRAGLRDLVSM